MVQRYGDRGSKQGVENELEGKREGWKERDGRDTRGERRGKKR